MNRERTEQLIREERFEELLTGAGWDLANETHTLQIRGGQQFPIQVKVQKRGFAVCICNSDEALQLSRTEKRLLLNELSKKHYEHLLIIHGTLNGKKMQCWQVSIRQQDRPLRVAEVVWHEGQNVQILLEKLAGLVFPLAEEETLTIADVVERVRFTFATNYETVTKRFYTKFKEKHEQFSTFIEGINEQVDKKRYASLMLNRLMFIYFIQKKGFLSGDRRYLKNCLARVQSEYGRDKFHNKFYRHFLHTLFHEGLNTPTSKRTDEVKQLLGNIPYVNGGLFDFHRLENENEKINIKDAAFEKLFAFFDEYNWHLDTRHSASGRDINPDVLGYIFEKYINERAQMGAYYTQEDITSYIAKNTILPFLLNKTKENCKDAFNESEIWQILRRDPECYIYDVVKHGMDLPDSQIPSEISQGIAADEPNLLQRRQHWNEPATSESPESLDFALPTETWREVIARRQRCAELVQKIENGEIKTINDLITYNLDIVKFTGDILSQYEGANFIAAMFRALAGVKHKWREKTNEKVKRGISVLDPACGSGAFLFAALNILQPIYHTCVERMEEFVDGDDKRINDRGGGSPRFLFFRKVLDEIAEHPNREYWIYKTIILENLYGVDMMEEAAEVAKLRLFLKLAAEAEYAPDEINCGLEPLPDIDYNIRSGNSLVGYANMKQFSQSVHEDLASRRDLVNEIKNQTQEVQRLNFAFKASQDNDEHDYVQSKQALTAKLKILNKKLDKYLALTYGKTSTQQQKEWKKTHQPFHWLAEFYDIIENNNGFDTIIGNPPYVMYSETRRTYTVNNYTTIATNNLYAMFIEQSKHIGKHHIGMIVQLPLVCTDGMQTARAILSEFTAWCLTFDDRPGKLFNDLENIRACVFLTSAKEENNVNICSTKYNRWYSSIRETVFKNISLINHADMPCYSNVILKIGDKIGKNIYQKLMDRTNKINDDLRGEYSCYFHDATRYWIRTTDFVPYFWNERNGEKMSSHVKILRTEREETATALTSIMNSSLFYWWYIALSDCRDVIRRDINNFPINLRTLADDFYSELLVINEKLMANYREHAIRKTTYRTTGKVIYDEFRPKFAKSIMDEADFILAQYYGFTEEELDYIINYDIKYRMGDKA